MTIFVLGLTCELGHTCELGLTYERALGGLRVIIDNYRLLEREIKSKDKAIYKRLDRTY